MRTERTIYRVGATLRNPLIPARLRFLERSQWWSRERLARHQVQALRQLLHDARKRSGLRCERLATAGIDPRDVEGLDVLARLPVTTKQDLLDHARKNQSRRPADRRIQSETSGSTGQPLVFRRDRNWDAWQRASQLRGFHWHGVEPWMRSGYLWGYDKDARARRKTRLLDRLQNRFRLFSYDDEAIDAFVEELRYARYLTGYSSMIYEVAKRVVAQGMGPIPLKMVKGTSEKIFPHYQDPVREAFQTKLISEYGAAETGVIAFECPEGNMHLNLETAIVEVEDGEILVTNLVSRAFPILRYRLGDAVVLDEETRCACGRAHPIVKDVTGRVGQVLRGHAKTYPSLTLYYVFKNLATRHGLSLDYQAVQREPGRLEIRIGSETTERERALVMAEAARYFEDDVHVDVLTAPAIREPGRKRRDVLVLG